MTDEPLAGQERDLFECAWFFEQMRRSCDDFQPDLSAYVPHRFTIHVENGGVQSADDEQCRRKNAREGCTREIGAAPARHDC